MNTERLEDRLYLAGDFAPGQADAIIGWNEANQNWEAASTDGSNPTFARPARDWQPPLAADTDGDGIDELWVRDLARGDWWRIDVAADGSFTEAFKGGWSPESQLRAVGAADITGDGREEIIGWSQETGTWLMLTNPAGQYSNVNLSNWAGGQAWNEPVVDDINGDGTAEILIQSAAYGSWWQLAWAGGSAVTTRFGAWHPNQGYQFAGLADLDGDGEKELLGNHGTGWIATFAGGDEIEFSLPATATNAVLGDFDGDLRDELITHDTGDGFWRATNIVAGAVTSTAVAYWNPAKQYSDATLADVTGDGIVDLVGRNHQGAWWSSSIDPHQRGNTFLRGWSATAGWRWIHFADIDGDGRTDILANHQSRDTWVAIRHDGTSYVSEVISQSVASAPSTSVSVVSGHLTSASTETLVAWNAFAGALVGHRIEAGSWQSSVVSHKAYRPKLERLFSIDADGDGRSSPIGWDRETESLWMPSVAEGTLHDQFLTEYFGSADSVFEVADLENDGREELVSFDPQTGHWQAARFDSQPRREFLAGWDWEGEPSDIWLADLDGNGALDLIARDQQGQITATLREAGDPQTDSFAGWEHLNDTHHAVTDFDGDGRAEIAMRDSLLGYWHLLRWTGGGFASSIVGGWSTTSAFRDVHLADLNGDGRLEFVGHQSTGAWWAAMFENGGFHNHRIGFWEPGVYFHYAGTADLDGDGAEEIIGIDPTYDRAIAYNAAGGTLYSTNETSAEQIDWGSVIVSDDGGDQQWLLAPTASGQWHRFRLDGATIVQQTVATPAGNWRDTITVSVADVSDDGLRQRLLEEVTGLAASIATGNRLTAARLLLDWTTNSVNFALSSPLSQASTYRAIELPVGELYYRFLESNHSGFYCGGAAAFLTKVLALFDIPALRVDFGEQRYALTHSTVVVPIDNGGETAYTIFDPTFHVEFRLAGSSTPSGILELIDAYQQGNVDQAGVVQRSKDAMDWVIESNLPLPKGMESEFELLRIEGDRAIYRRPGYGLHTYTDAIESHLQLLGFPTGTSGFVALMAERIFLIEPNGVGDHAGTLANEFAARGIPVG